jgi:hypothetical protein
LSATYGLAGRRRSYACVGQRLTGLPLRIARIVTTIAFEFSSKERSLIVTECMPQRPCRILIIDDDAATLLALPALIRTHFPDTILQTAIHADAALN